MPILLRNYYTGLSFNTTKCNQHGFIKKMKEYRFKHNIYIQCTVFDFLTTTVKTDRLLVAAGLVEKRPYFKVTIAYHPVVTPCIRF